MDRAEGITLTFLRVVQVYKSVKGDEKGTTPASIFSRFSYEKWGPIAGNDTNKEFDGKSHFFHFIKSGFAVAKTKKK